MIEWNKITWYSRFAALILFLGAVPALTFYIGMQYELTLVSVQTMPSSSSQTYLQKAPAADAKNATYVIDGQPVQLVNGTAETEAAPGSASNITTTYFGDELNADINGDGKADAIFLLTQNTGGSGTFYYVVADLSSAHGYVGSGGYLLGDRIAPQNIELSQHGGQQNTIVVNYADRLPIDPMTAQPSVAKSVYLTLSTTTMQWAVQSNSH